VTLMTSPRIVLFGMFLSETAAAPASGTGGRIIFVSATLHYTGVPMQTHVGVAKAGVDALSNSVAIEQGPKGVTSNVIAPGPIAGTEGMDRLAKADTAKNAAKKIPSGRWGSVKEIADATVFLFSDSGNYVNGSVVVGKYMLQCSHATSGCSTANMGTQWMVEHGVRREP